MILYLSQDFLNNKLQECFLQRIRHAMKPDEAFGLIFSWDNVVVIIVFFTCITRSIFVHMYNIKIVVFNYSSLFTFGVDTSNFFYFSKTLTNR